MVPLDSRRISRARRYLGEVREIAAFRLRGYYPLWLGFHRHIRLGSDFLTPTRTFPRPRYRRSDNGLGCSPFARHYSGNRGCFLFLGLLRCFSSPAYLRPPYFIQAGMTPYERRRVSPFGHLRVKACLQLAGAFSLLATPSSALSAKASTVRPW